MLLKTIFAGGCFVSLTLASLSVGSGYLTKTSLNCCSDTIFWDENAVLSWEDFTGEPPPLSAFNASTYAGIKYRFMINGEIATINIRSYFFKPKSWAAKDSLSTRLLRHELFHFHITEIFSRKLKKEIAEIKSSALNFAEFIKSRHRFYLDASYKLQSLYDEETKHSVDTIAQNRWEQNLLDSLEAYRVYSKPEILVQLN